MELTFANSKNGRTSVISVEGTVCIEKNLMYIDTYEECPDDVPTARYDKKKDVWVLTDDDTEWNSYYIREEEI